MGMLPSYIKLVGSMHTRYRFEGPICSIGNQDIWVSCNDLKRCLETVGCAFHEPLAVIGHSSRTFGLNAALAETAKAFVYAKAMFEAKGIEGYLDMDKFVSDNPALLHDLNDPIPADRKSRFGMVFEGGAIEHIFDVCQVMGNIVDMLRQGGCVVYLCSLAIDHGFHGLSPVLFYDCYGANGLGEFERYAMGLDLSDVTPTYVNRHRCATYEYGMSLDGEFDTSKEILIFFAVHKQLSLPALTVPTLGAYVCRGNIAKAPAEVAQSGIDFLPAWVKQSARPSRPLLRAAYRKYRRAQTRRAATVRYI